METTFSMFSPVQSRSMPQSLAFGAQPKEPVSLTEKYRPQSFADLFGQSFAVDTLTQFASNPYPMAFLFHGETGTGKTSAALALANELGVDANWSLHRISAGEMDAEAVAFALKSLRFSAPNGGWKIVVCDEADSMSAKAKQMWLSALEELPSRSVVVFTTNHRSKFEPRFLHRCEEVAFESDADTLYQDAQRFLETMWHAEAMPGTAPDVRSLDLAEKGHISFRRIVRYVEACKRRLPLDVKPVQAPEKQNPDNMDTRDDTTNEPAKQSTKSAVKSTGVDPKSLDWDTIALRYLDGESQKTLASEYGVSHGCVFSRLKKMAITRGEK
jgi:ATPase family associated with various cellular activities (AAA)